MLVDLTKTPYTILSLYIPTTAVYKKIKFRYANVAYIAARCKKDSDLVKFKDLTNTQAMNLLPTVEINTDFDTIKEDVLYEIFINRFNENKYVRQILKDTCLEPIYNFDDNNLDLGLCRKTFEGNNLVGKVWEKIRKEQFYSI